MMLSPAAPLSIQDMIRTLQDFWAEQGCAVLQPYDMEVGAGTFHPTTTLYCLGPTPWRFVHVQPSRRPSDGRYGLNPNRMQRFHQLQVILKPSPDNVQQLYLESLERIGLDTKRHDIRFVEDDWEGPTLGASGLGWEVWCDGMEVTQFTYMQTMGGFDCHPVAAEIAYGIERLAMFVQGKNSQLELAWNSPKDPAHQVTYRDLFFEAERQFSYYNLEYADTEMLLRHFQDIEKEAFMLLGKQLPLPAYDLCLKTSHLFNMLDARGVISVTERASYIARVRAIAKMCCAEWLKIQGIDATGVISNG
jgi:glycyl-tRNA synthetase alpha chain